MITLLQFLFRKVPAHWWRKSLRNILITAFSFYMLGLTERTFMEKYLSLFINDLFWRFILFNLLSYVVFYCVADFLLRALAYKLIKRWVEKKLTEPEFTNAKFEVLRAITTFRNVAVGFITGMPVEYGYINSAELNAVSRELSKIEYIEVSVAEQESAINEIISGINKWLCVLIHLIVTLLLVWQFNQTLMVIIMIAGFLLTMLFYIAVIMAIKNIEFINVVLKSFSKANFGNKTGA